MGTPKRMRRVLAVVSTAVVLVGQPGCQMLVGTIAMEGGKHVYKKLKEDKERKEAAKQGPERSEQSEPAKVQEKPE